MWKGVSSILSIPNNPHSFSTCTYTHTSPFFVHHCKSRGSPFPLLPLGLPCTLQLWWINILLSVKKRMREIRQNLGMAVAIKQWIKTDMHLFIYIRNGPLFNPFSLYIEDTHTHTRIHKGPNERWILKRLLLYMLGKVRVVLSYNVGELSTVFWNYIGRVLTTLKLGHVWGTELKRLSNT